MLTAVSILSFAAWVYLAGFRGGFWRSGPVLPSRTPTVAPSVAVVVPARDESPSIRQSLTSLLQQNYPGTLSIVLVDDNSTDATAEIAASLAFDERLTILRGKPLPPGWSGKLWAVHQGLACAAAARANYILLTDADIVHAPTHVSSLVAHAEVYGLNLVSEMVHLHCDTAPERALIPAFVFFFQMLYPFDWVADQSRTIAGAAGGTMLVNRAALGRIGGVSRIRHQLIDDCALACEIKSAGGGIWLGHSEQAASMRIYVGWADIWNMIARTAYVQLRHSPLILIGSTIGMAIIYWAPPLLVFSARGLPRRFGALGWLLMTATFQPTLRRYHRSPLWGLAMPAIAAFYMAATLASAIRHHAGRGGGWKNRVYPADQAGEITPSSPKAY